MCSTHPGNLQFWKHARGWQIMFAYTGNPQFWKRVRGRQVMFAYATGPLAWSIIAFRNSLVFHSLDKVPDAPPNHLPSENLVVSCVHHKVILTIVACLNYYIKFYPLLCPPGWHPCSLVSLSSDHKHGTYLELLCIHKHAECGGSRASGTALTA